MVLVRAPGWDSIRPAEGASAFEDTDGGRRPGSKIPASTAFIIASFLSYSSPLPLPRKICPLAAAEAQGLGNSQKVKAAAPWSSHISPAGGDLAGKDVGRAGPGGSTHVSGGLRPPGAAGQVTGLLAALGVWCS